MILKGWPVFPSDNRTLDGCLKENRHKIEPQIKKVWSEQMIRNMILFKEKQRKGDKER